MVLVTGASCQGPSGLQAMANSMKKGGEIRGTAVKPVALLETGQDQEDLGSVIGERSRCQESLLGPYQDR